jgi:ATP-dependent DNA ligase
MGPAWVTNGWYPGDGATMFEVCSQLGHEGVVAKHLDAPYLPGRRSRMWLKQKCPSWVREHAPRRRPAEARATAARQL